MFLGRIGLPGQQGLVHVKVAAREDAAIRRDQVARDQLDDVTRNDLVHRDCDSSLPSRRAVACTATERRSASIAFCARNS